MVAAHTAARTKRTKVEDEPIDLAKLVEKCVVDAKYANAPASDLLIKLGYSDTRVYNAICKLGFELLCTEMVGKFIRNHSANIRAQAERERAQREAAAKAKPSAKEAPARPKMDVREGGHLAALRSMVKHVSAAAIMPIQGYGRLCDMTFAQVREAADTQDKQATTMAIRVRYLRAVYAAGGKNSESTRTGAVLADADFIKLHDQETAHAHA